MNKLHFIFYILILSQILTSCSDDKFNKEDVPETVYANYHEKEKHLSDLIPQYILDKLEAGESLTKEDRYNVDNVSYTKVHYNGINYTTEEMYESDYLYEKYMSKETFSGIYNNHIILFDSEKELEDFEENPEGILQMITPDYSRNWWTGDFNWRFLQSFAEHTNFDGARLSFQRYFSNGAQNVGIVLPTNWWYRVSSSLTRTDNSSFFRVIDQKVSFIGHNTDRFYFNLVDGNSGQREAYLEIDDYRKFTTFDIQEKDQIVAGTSGSSHFGVSSHSNQNDKLIAFTLSTHLASDSDELSKKITILSYLNSFTNALTAALGGNPSAAFQIILNMFSEINNNNVEGEIVSLSGNFKIRKPNSNKYLVIDPSDPTEMKMRDNYSSHQWFLIPDNIEEFGDFPGFHNFRAQNGYTVDQHETSQSNVFLSPFPNQEGNRRKWIILQYNKWYWHKPEYKIMNVQTGQAIHWDDNNSVYMSTASPTRDPYERFHLE